MPGLVRAPAGKAVLGVRLKAAVNSAHVKWADYCSKSVKCESTCLHFQPRRCALASASCDLSVPVTRMLFPSRRRSLSRPPCIGRAILSRWPHDSYVAQAV